MGLFKNRDAAKAPQAEPDVAPDVPRAQVRGTGLSGTEMQRLWADGLEARATVKEIRDTGQRLAGNAVIDLDVAVTREGEEPYETTMRLPVPDAGESPFAPGSEYNVRVDPDDQTRLVFAA